MTSLKTTIVENLSVLLEYNVDFLPIFKPLFNVGCYAEFFINLNCYHQDGNNMTVTKAAEDVCAAEKDLFTQCCNLLS